MNKRKRPYWQKSDPCPEWCGTMHEDHDGGSDRDHMSKWSKQILLTTQDSARRDYGDGDGDVRWLKCELDIWVHRRYREREPRIVIAPVYGEHGEARHYTIDEALKLIKALTVAVDIAEGHANPGGA